MRRISLAAFAGTVFSCWTAGGQPPVPHHEAARTGADIVVTPPNVASRTLGGTQFWSDELIYYDLHIQRNALTGHYRLLDESNRRRAWGTFDHCRMKLDALKSEQKLPPLKGKIVIVLHGLGRTRGSMAGMCRYLKEQGGYVTLNMSYASTRETIDDHARSLARVIEPLDGADEINFVAHSMGNLVIRRYLQRQKDEGRSPDSRIKRIVMLAPPNQGSQLASRLNSAHLIRWFWGKSGTQIAGDWEQLEQRLAIPFCEFAIIAGGRGVQTGRNPLVKGDDDLVVSVEETRLEGASDFAVVPAMHTFMMNDAQVKAFTLSFLQNGCFISADQREPIPAGADPLP